MEVILFNVFQYCYGISKLFLSEFLRPLLGMYADVLLRGELVLFKLQDTLQQRHLQVRMMQSSTIKNSQVERQDSKIDARESIEIVPNYNWSFPVKKL